MPGAQGRKTVKGAQSDPNYVSRLLARSECLPGGGKIVITPLPFLLLSFSVLHFLVVVSVR